jgi:undecaprenyl pyrophosphate phosphatase UppP
MLSRTWQDWIGVAAGVWLIASPWILGFSATTGALWTFVILGVVVVGVALYAMNRNGDTGRQWLLALVGAATIAAPWVFGFGLTAIRWNGWIVGALVAVLALWALAAREDRPARRVPG